MGDTGAEKSNINQFRQFPANNAGWRLGERLSKLPRARALGGEILAQFDRLSGLSAAGLNPAFDFPIDCFFNPALARAVETSLKAITKPRARVRILVAKFKMNAIISYQPAFAGSHMSLLYKFAGSGIIISGLRSLIDRNDEPG